MATALAGTGYSPAVIDWLNARGGISEEIAELVGFSSIGNTIRFQYEDADGKYFRTRKLPGGQAMQPRGRRLSPWTPLGTDGVLLVLEGESDLLSVASALYTIDNFADDGEEPEFELVRRADLPPPVANIVPVAVPGVGNCHRQIADLAEGLVADVLIAFDGDEAGRTNAAKLAAKINAKANVSATIVPAPDGRDISDLLSVDIAADEDSAEALANLIVEADAAEEVPVEGDVDDDREPVPDTTELLDAVAATIRRFVILTDAQRDVEALWVLHAHAIEAADTTPYLGISSPEKQSGKSRDLEVLARLVPRAMEAANVSDAALFRALSGDDGPATLLYDEVDTLFGRSTATTKEEQRGLLNAGYRRGAVAWRCEGDGSKQTVTPYPVFGAKALAGIGELPETLADRSIPIRLRRRRPDEQVERGRYKTIEGACEPLRRAAARWARENVDRLRDADPCLPETLSDRAQDGAEPLIAIADLAGGEWPQQARTALVELHSDKADEAESWGVRLLADIRLAFDGDGGDRIATADLLERLQADEEAPWAAWGKTGAGLAPRGLAKLLTPYGIRSRTIRLDSGGTAKGYKRTQFEDAWERYISYGSDAQPSQRHNGSVEQKTGTSHPTHRPLVSDGKEVANPHSRANVTDVTAGTHIGGNGTVAATEAEEAEVERIAAKVGGAV